MTSQSPAVAPPPDQQHPEAPERIVRAAEELFSEKGYDAVSMSAIAARAGVSKANIFHHYSTKDNLYVAVMERVCRASAALLDELVGRSGSCAERLAHFARVHLANIRGHEAASRLLLREILASDARRGEELARRVFGNNFARLVGLVRDGQRRGELRRDIDPAMAAVLIVGANVFFFQSSAVLRHLPDVDFGDQPERYAEMVTDILLHGVLQPGPRGVRK